MRMKQNLDAERSVALTKTCGNHTHIDEKVLIETLRAMCRAVRKQGKTPLVLADLDGTVVDCREYTWRNFEKFMDHYDGEHAEAIRAAAEKEGRFDAWNNCEYLRCFGFNDQKLHDYAWERYTKTFFDPHFRLTMKPIPGSTNLMKMLQEEEGAKLGFLTLRAEVEDRIEKSKPAGTDNSTSVGLMKTFGLWKEDKAFILRHEGKPIDWSPKGYADGPAPEPEKWRMAQEYEATNPDTKIVAVLENDPRHVIGHRENFGSDVMLIHVQGDVPPHSPEIPAGVYTVNPFRFGIVFRNEK